MKNSWYIYLRAAEAETLSDHFERRHIPRGHPLACVSVHTRTRSDGEGTELYSYGVSVWNPSDVFSKTSARNKADGRNVQEEGLAGLAVADVEPPSSFATINLAVLEALQVLPYTRAGGRISGRLPHRVMRALEALIAAYRVIVAAEETK